MTDITRREALARLGGGAAAALMGFAPGAPGAERRHTVTVATLVGPNKPETRTWHFIRDRIEAKLPGRFRFRIVPNAALAAGEKEIAEGIRLGSIQASVNTTATFGGWSPRTQILDLPFLFRNREHLQGALLGDLGESLKSALNDEGFVALAYVNYGVRYLMAKESILTPAGLAGKRVRSIPNPVHTEMWKAFQAQPVTLPIAETYNALKTGVADAMDLNKSAYAALKLYEVVPCLMETAHIWASGVLYVSAGFWQKLDDEEKAVFSEAASEGARHFDELILADEAVAVEEARKAGGRIVPIEKRLPWEDAARKVWEIFAPRLGGLERINAIHDAR
jgi:TRAP-type C4-dicarboxylate transport system substrate-binding protein